MPALFHELVCLSLDLPVLEFYLPLIGDEQDPVIRYRFLAIGCPDIHGVRLQADVGAAHAGPVVGCTAVTIPDADVPGVVAVIVPELLQEFMAGQHNPSHTGRVYCRSWQYIVLFSLLPFCFYGWFTMAGFFPKARYPRKQVFPGSLTRNLYRKKIPEIMKMVDKSA